MHNTSWSAKPTQLIFDQWFNHEPGKRIWQEECSVLSKFLHTVSADYLLQLGGSQCVDLLVSCRGIKNFVYLSPEDNISFLGSSIQSNFSPLAVQPNCIDIVILWHILEWVEAPEEALHEAIQTLRPEGYLMILGLNADIPSALFKRLLPQHRLPYLRTYRLAQLKRQLIVHGLQVIQSQTFCSDLPRHTSKQNNLFWRCMRSVLSSLTNQVYLIVAQKKQMTLTPLRYKNAFESLLPSAQADPLTNSRSLKRAYDDE